MPLTLNITSYQRLSPGQETSKQLDRGRLTIGRAPENDWVLSDPEMVLSKSHCMVEYRDGTYYLTDTSTNGVFVNHADQRLGRGNSVVLDDQDVLSLGDYEIQVRIGDGLHAAPVPDASMADYAGESSDLFSVITEQVDIQDQFRQASDKLQPEDQLGLDRTIAPSSDSDPLGLDEDTGQPDWDQHSSADHLPADREFFRPPEASPEPMAPPPQPEPPPAARPTPAAKPSEPDKVIPDDWEDSLILKPPLAESPPAGSPAEEPRSERDTFDDLLGEDIEPPGPAAPTDEEPGIRTEQIDLSDLYGAAEPPPAAPESVPAEEPPATPSPAPSPAVKPRVGGSDEAAALRAFLHGAGLDDLDLSSEDAAAMMQRIGLVFRQTAQGMMDLLRARSSVKNEFRVERTMIMALENNPLKQLPNVEEAMKAMLTRHDNIWMPADKAINEGFADIRAHELAMVAGMQAALQHLLETFDPQQLEQELGEPSRLGSLFGGGKARYWDAFNKLYGRIAAKAEDDFQQLFRQEFAKAYEAQLHKLRQR